MNPADVAQAALPLPSADVSLIALFWQAHWIVKCVMLGLISCSVWVWAIAACFVAAMREWKRSFESQARSFGGLQMRIEKVMNVSIAREVERLERRLLVLATVGSASPFVGLFGTVWGIMSSFQSIAASKNTSLAVVAPGIAEALFATAIGLIAAIPATIFYNKFISEVNRQAQRLEGFADEFSAILSRQIDERA
jgi:biopolymer transport protein TolQ